MANNWDYERLRKEYLHQCRISDELQKENERISKELYRPMTCICCERELPPHEFERHAPRFVECNDCHWSCATGSVPCRLQLNSDGEVTSDESS